MSDLQRRWMSQFGSLRTAVGPSATALSRVWTWLMPALVVGVALAWFGTIPPYSPPSLPDDWDPECVEWKPEWKSLSTPADTTVGLVRESHTQRDDELLIRISNSPQMRLQRLRMNSGEVLAESSSLPSSVVEVLDEGIRLHNNHMNGPLPALAWLDLATLQLQREMRLQSTQWQLGARNDVLIEALAELPDNHIAGIMEIRFHSGGRHSYWFRAAPDGEIAQIQELASPRMMYRPWPPEAPRWFLLQAQDDPTQIEAMDVATGAHVALPKDLTLTVKAAYSGYPTRHAPLPTGHGNAMDEERRIRGYWALMPEASHPLVFGRQPEEAPLTMPQQIQMQLGFIRRGLWRARYGAAVVTDRANEAYRLDALLCYHPESAAGDRLLTGSVLEVARTQLHVSEIRLRQYASDFNGIAELEPEAYMAALETGVSVTRLGDGHLLVEQLVMDFPKGLTEAPAICRYGLLRKDETAVAWLGWLPVSEKSPYGPSAPKVEIRDDVLLLWNSGLNRPANQNQPAVARDFQWATLPLPPEFVDLPEGESR